ncbi:1159_t:CDS:2, partial [Acaulospora colombiana]
AMMVGRSNFLSRSQYNAPPPTVSTVGPPETIALEKASNWKYLFMGQGIQAMLSLVLAADTPPTYKATLALDKKLRAYDSFLDPTFLTELGNPPEKNTASCRSKRLRQFFVLLAKESTLLHLHRSFLNRAVINPDATSSHSQFFRYQSACAIIREYPDLYDCQPVLNRLEEAASGAYGSRDNHPLKVTTATLPEVRRPLDGIETAQETTPVSSDGSIPMASQQTLEGVFEGDNGLLDSTFFSTSYPLDPTYGGMNWHYIPRNPSKKNTIEENLVIEQGDANALWTELLQQLSSSDPSLQSTLE